ncbi:hypothetical protein C2G38_2051713, partial [Gigaspora rosea]
MYICITANSPIDNLYTKLRGYNSSIDIEAFKRRDRFIIKFEGEPIDSCVGKDRVITNIPKSVPGKRKLIFSTKNNVKKFKLIHGSITESNQISNQYYTTVKSDIGIETEYDSDPQIESSTQQQINYQYSEDSNDISEPESELHSDDSAYTRTKKKGKSKEVIEPQDNIDDEQKKIQANYQEINMNGKRNLEPKFLVDANNLCKNHVLDIGEDSRL